ncbi:MAG: DUF4838 domain-containing protein [Ferruginibacter sp.]
MRFTATNLIIYLISLFFMEGIAAQTISIPVYYSPVDMPASLKTNYYGQFDTQLLAEDLAALLQRATKRSFTVTAFRPGAVKGIFLLLDSSSGFSSNETGKLESDGKSFIRIKAKYTTGIAYAMYSWLEQLGFHFYLPGDEWTIIPSLPAVFNKNIIKKTYRPYFRLRMFNASGGIFAVKGLDEGSQNEKDWQQWYQRNRMGCEYISIDGHIGEWFNIVHKKEIEKDTAILAPINGKRKYSEEGKLDPTYKKGVALFSDWIVDESRIHQKQMPAFLPYKKYYSVDAGDGLNYCHTPQCESQFKTVSDQVFSIANETARKIKRSDARAGVSLLAYTERADTPSIRIESNVHVMVVPTAFQSVSISTELMQRWAKKTTNISQYDFLNIGVWAYDTPFFDLYQYHNNLQFIKSLGIEGMSFETSLSKFSSGVQQYFILKFLCEPYRSIESILDEFCKNNFETAAVPIKKLLKEWYFSDIHLAGYDKNSFYEDELGRFIGYIMEAENTAGISIGARKRIEELKAYTVYLCKFYEMFTDLKNLESFASDPSLRSAKAEELLTYTWQMYHHKIFHNTQLNDMLKQYVVESKRAVWDFRNSDHFKGIAENAGNIIKTEFEKEKKKYLPAAIPAIPITDAFLFANTKYSADSIRITTIDETAFGNYSYSLQFYCAAPGTLKIFYSADSSRNKNNKRDKVAIIGVESADYRYIKNDFVYKENSSGMIIYRIPFKGHYKLYLSQYNATHIAYTIYPGKNLFYYNKRHILMNGILMQDNSEKNYYPNKYLAFIAPATDSLYFANLYWSCNNTIHLHSGTGKDIPVNISRQPFLNSAAIPKSMQSGFIFYSNTVFRWPPVLKNTVPCYFFLKYPLK